MKACLYCEIEKPLADFFRNPKGRGRPPSACRDCSKLPGTPKRPKRARSETDRERSREAKILNRDLARHFVWDYKLSNPCVDCGESDPIVLHFDHIADNKTAGISTLIQQSASVKRIQKEIDKCEVRCANCHMRVTALRGNWWRPEASALEAVKDL